MKHTLYSIVLIFFMITVSVNAAGKKESGEYSRVEGLQTWTAEEDISALPDGKYNIIVKGEDTAGNVSIAGPYNIFISAQSDLATVNIANPTEGMIVSDNLNIVGDAFDDDGVSLVELKLDDGSYQKCTGTSFWNYYVDLSELAEGLHTIAVRATDINNLAGKERTVSFTVDKNPPVSTIVSHKQGSILSGSVILQGEVHDAGGIKEAFFSTDGKEYTKLKISFNKKKNLWEFSQKINTKKMEDGTYTYWYRIVDTSGTEGLSSFLFFADNQSPELTVINPQDGAEVNGKITFSGTIRDTIGTKSLWLSIGADTYDIPLTPGDPYWAVDVDLASLSSSVTAECTAEDFAGNKTIEKIRLKNSVSSDLPVISLYVPESIGVLQETVSVGISLTDDDGVKGYEYVLDGGEPAFKDAPSASVLSFSGLEPGRHSLQATPYDSNSVPGKTVSKSFTVPKVSAKEPEKPAPAISFEGVVNGTVVKEKAVIKGKVISDAGLASLDYSLTNDPEGEWKSVYVDSITGTFSSEIAGSALKEGPNIILFRAVDSAGNSSSSFITFIKDSLPPEVVLFTPVEDDSINGKITVSGMISDISPEVSCEYSINGKEFNQVDSAPFFHFDIDYSSFEQPPESLVFRTVDGNENSKTFQYPLKINREVDIPVVSIQFPGENATLRGDFILSGTALDDDGIKTIYYALDDNDFTPLEGTSAFQIPVTTQNLDDTLHTVRIKAEDLNGVMSLVETREFNISRIGPVIHVTEPAADTFVKGSVPIKGTASDTNGIQSVLLSLDNGSSYTSTGGTDEWVYMVDTTLLHDGTHSLYVKSFDSANSVSYYTTILNVDNTPPEIKLDSPLNGSSSGGTLLLNGKISDNEALKSLKLDIVPLGPQKGEESHPVSFNLGLERVLQKKIDTSGYPGGWYTLRMEAVDMAGNVTYETRSIRIVPLEERGRIHLLYPLEGDQYNSFMRIEGTVMTEALPASVVIIVDDSIIGTADVDDRGRFLFTGDSSTLPSGSHSLMVKSSAVDSSVTSEIRNFTFNPNGPWILFEKSSGDFLTQRTFVKGSLGYTLEGEGKRPEVTDFAISYDNGRTFSKVKPVENWKTRIETEMYPDGPLPVLARVKYSDNSSAYAKMIFVIDKTPPVVKLENPKEGKSFNNSLTIEGSADDNSEVKNVMYLVREGDKNSYEIPSFIQGLYIDFHALGATYGEIGAGLTFFDDNVKLQLEAGIAPPGRFSGAVLGGKLLANIATVPYSFMFGPDWQNFSLSAAVGAKFSYFTMSDTGISFSTPGVILGSVLGQIELIKYRVPDLSMFNTYSLYAEGSLWFISSDVQAGVVPRYSLGARIGIF